jgi:ATP-binding cassette subfamily B protein
VMVAATPRLWLLLAILGLAPAFVASRLSPELLAVVLGAVLLAGGGLVRLAGGLLALASARIAWTQVAPLLEAARRPEPTGLVEGARPPEEAAGELISAHEVGFSFPERMEPVLRGLSLRIARGDRTLLSGPSGAGKSTLLSLLTGLRDPGSGILLLDGLDRATLGPAAWRRRVAAAVQFHENHVFNDTLAFNLLMGRRWPPREEDLAMAEDVCRRLGLGELIDRMPGGLFQLVGETGWQLSHGERSRLFVARALLQGAELVILDESFAELDPESLRDCLRELRDLAPTLLVVAHA